MNSNYNNQFITFKLPAILYSYNLQRSLIIHEGIFAQIKVYRFKLPTILNLFTYYHSKSSAFLFKIAIKIE